MFTGCLHLFCKLCLFSLPIFLLSRSFIFSWFIKALFIRTFLLGRKAMTNLNSLLKSRDITLPTMVHLVKAMFFPVVMYGCESWTIKKAECRRIDAFEVWCWRRLLRVPWTSRRSNQSILKETSAEYSLEELMLKLKLQYFGHLMRRADLFEKTLMLGKIDDGKRRGWQRMRWLDGITDSMDMGLVNSSCWWWTGRPGVLQFMGSQRAGHDWVTELNWIKFIDTYLQLRSQCLGMYSTLTLMFVLVLA